VLGVAASALLDLRVDAADVLGDRGRRLEDELLAARGPVDRILEAHVRRWAPAPPDRLVTAAVEALRVASPGSAALADMLGVSERQLRRRFTAAIGYGPKTFARVVRLRRFVAAARDRRATLAELALEAGYADQPHLTRECRELAGCTPSVLAGYPLTAA
jgi:AraC-like DNA-binding protein